VRIKKQPPGVAEGDLTPMIDMTFQLIAFFMVLVNFSQAEQTEAIQLPSSALAKAPEEQPDHPLTINILKDGKFLLAGQEYDEIDSITLDQERQFAQDSNTEVTVIIRAHKDSQTGKVQELIKKCQESNLESFVLRVKEEVPGTSK
jgi:biopolymer transport protein ExbD